MPDLQTFYINGEWVDASDRATLPIINPADRSVIGNVAMGTERDVNLAVAAARQAFSSFAATSVQDRIDLLGAIAQALTARQSDMGDAISQEMGAPIGFARNVQAACGPGHFAVARSVLKSYPFEERLGQSLVVREPVGVCGLITPWNWPINQIACKVAPAIAAGCTVVLKPSEIAPLSAQLFAEILHDAGLPAGVFNMVHGDGPTVGAAISAHPQVDMVSFTGSTRAGIAVAQAAASTVKRVAQELGGKSANIILDDADLGRAVKVGTLACMNNSGQSCNAPTRMLVAEDQYDDALSLAAAAIGKVTVGDPQDPTTTMGPVASEAQFKRVQSLLATAIDEGATVVAGGPGSPDGLEHGFYCRPTVFGNVNNQMTIAREEVFGPVLVIIPYRGEAEAIELANDTPYGLSGYVWSGDEQRARRVAASLRTGNVHINGAHGDFKAPFGGYKQSGNGREWGQLGVEEFLETKAIMGA